MYPNSFAYDAPASVDEAVRMLREHPEAKVLSGGMSLIPMMKLRLAEPAHLVDLCRIADLKEIRRTSDGFSIGAAATYDDIVQSSVLRDGCPVLGQVAQHVGDVQVRNRGTFGGCLVHADPAGDMPAAAFALDATLTIAGPHPRTVHIAEFIEDALTTSLGEHEILTHIQTPSTSRYTAYAKMPQQASGYALVGVAVVLDIESHQCRSARIGITGVCSRAFRATAVEQALVGQTLAPGSISEAAKHVRENISDPLSDPLSGSGAYRTHLAEVYLRRAIEQALRNGAKP